MSTKADRETLINIAYTSLATKLKAVLAKKLASDVVDAVLTIRPPSAPIGYYLSESIAMWFLNALIYRSVRVPYRPSYD